VQVGHDREHEFMGHGPRVHKLLSEW
jgi:hypothetical protein